jgi:hypothetical protein
VIEGHLRVVGAVATIAAVSFVEVLHPNTFDNSTPRTRNRGTRLICMAPVQDDNVWSGKS